MKKLWLVLMFVPQMSWSAWHGLSLPDWSKGIYINPVASREFVNGQWLAGYSLDVLYWQIPGSFRGRPLPKVYFSLDHQWNASELISAPGKAQGIWGPAAGVAIGGLASTAQMAIMSAAGLLSTGMAQSLMLPPWLINDLDKWVTLEIGGGNRVLGNLNGVKPWGAWIGGKVSISFDVTAHH